MQLADPDTGGSQVEGAGLWKVRGEGDGHHWLSSHSLTAASITAVVGVCGLQMAHKMNCQLESPNYQARGY